jgi:hypothetical protein
MDLAHLVVGCCPWLQVRDLLKVEWVEGDPSRGLDYVYLAEEEYQKVFGSVKARLRVMPDGECTSL